MTQEELLQLQADNADLTFVVGEQQVQIRRLQSRLTQVISELESVSNQLADYKDKENGNGKLAKK